MLKGETGAQPPEDTVLVTVYVPGALAVKSTWPVEVLMNTNPDADENVPATPPPVKAGDGLASFLQFPAQD